MNEIVKALNVKYYLIYTLTIVLTFAGYFLDYHDFFRINGNVSLFNILPIVVVAVSVVLIVAGFVLFELKKKSIAAIENQWERNRTYIRYAGYRLYLIGICILIGIPVFYVTKNSITLYSIGLAAVALILSKPSESKIENDLNI